MPTALKPAVSHDGSAAAGDPGVVLRALGDPIRWQIVQRLASEQLCACHLTEELGLGQPLVSHHLKVLRDAGVIEGTRFRYWTYYRLVPDAFREVARTLRDLPANRSQPERRPCC